MQPACHTRSSTPRRRRRGTHLATPGRASATPSVGGSRAPRFTRVSVDGSRPTLVSTYDVVVVGSGPNGLAAAVTLAREGLSVLVIEAHDTPGGGARTEALTLPGFLHDVCSSVHPLGVASPFFQTLDLESVGVDWVQSPAALAHVLGEDSVVTLERSIDDTASQLGADGAAYRSLLSPFVERFDELCRMVLGPLRFPSSPVLLGRFGWPALQSLQGLARRRFTEAAAPALLAGISAHAMLPLDAVATASFGLLLGAAGHAVGWPIARGGSRAITSGLVDLLRGFGGELLLSHPVRQLTDLPPARAVVFDVTPRQLLDIAGDELPAGYRRRLAKFRYGPGVFKLDWALREPIPWKHSECRRAATVHLAGELRVLSASEAAVHARQRPEHPFVLLVQPTLFDRTRAANGRHTAWAYCHVPHGSDMDMVAALEGQVERFAPGFRDIVLARAACNAPAMERYNPNYVGGDINGGIADIRQLFFRPVASLDPYATAAPGLYLCSSSTPPGGGVHGMCGYWAAQSVLARSFRSRTSRGM